MSRDHRDKPGGHNNQYYGAGNRWVKFYKKHCRRVTRARERQDLQRGIEPPPTYPIERSYID